MVEFIRVSHEALKAIPYGNMLIMHQMYEDNDLEGAEQAEKVFGFIEQEKPGTFVALLANDSVSPSCITGLQGSLENHYHCDYYAPYWYTVLVSVDVWEKHKDAVRAKDREWKHAHRCKLLRDKEG